MANSPSIVLASLSDDQLKKSIDSLVTHVDEAMKKMVQSTNNAVGEMEAKLKSLGKTKIDSGGSADGGASRRAKAQNAETEAIEKNIAARDRQIKKGKESAMAFDQQASAMQKAIAPKSATDSYQVIISNMRQNVAALAKEIKSMPSMSLDRQFAAYMQYERQIEQVRNRIAELRQQMQEMANDPNASRLVKKQTLEEIGALQQKIVQIEREQIVATQQIANADKQVLAEKQAQYEKERQELIQLSAGQREKVTFAQSEAQVQGQITQEIKKQAQAIRESQEWKQSGKYRIFEPITEDGVRKYVTYVVEANKAKTIEEQLVEIEKQKARSLEILIQNQKAGVQEAQSELSVQQSITQEVEKRKKYTSPTTTINESFKRLTANALGVHPSEINSASTKISKMTTYVRQLETAYSNLTRQEQQSPFGRQLREEIQTTSRLIQQFRSEISRPVNLQAALQGSEKTLDDIAYKMRRLASYRSGLNVETQTKEIDQVNRKYTELQKKMNEVMGKNQQMIASNTALGRSWNYMKNRLAFYFSVGASTQFVKNLIEIRSQYEMNERALGILINSAERGTQIFNELSQMALVSPYTLIELSSAAKQLTAYDVAARDVVDTTRRLADMAAAVGIPMERLTYALGQIKAYGYLNSRDNRMFANAGIPLVKQLADYYTELEGRMVSTADVYDRIKKKAVDYNTVMQVIYRMTDEGGKFFDFQAKMAGTLKVQLANLTLAWNNMLNDIGKESQGVLTGGIGALKELFLHWRELDKLIKNTAWVVGMRTAFMLLTYGVLKLGGALGVTTKQMALSAVVGKRLAGVLRTVGGAMKTLATSKVTWFLVLAEAVWEAGNMIFRANQATVELNKSLREGAETNFKDISEYLGQYQKVADSLYKKTDNAYAYNYDLRTRKLENEAGTPTNINVDEANKAWEAMRERIELSTAASDDFVGRLLTIENVSERLRQGFILLNDIQQVNSAMKEMGDTAIVVTQDWSKWWNLWIGTDGLIDNLGDVKNELDDVVKKFGSLEEARKQATGTNEAWQEVSDYDNAMMTLKGDIDKTTESLNNFIRNMGFASNPDQVAETYAQALQKISAEKNLDPQRAYMLQQGFEEARGKVMKEALEARIADEEHALKLARDNETKESLSASIQRHEAQLELFTKYTDNQRTEFERFTKYMKENHISEMQAMFGQMDEEQLKSINWQEEKYLDFVKRTAAAYAKRHNMAYEAVFNRLWGLIHKTNLMQIFLKLTISTEEHKSFSAQLKEYDQMANDAYTNLKRIQERIAQLAAAGAESTLSKYHTQYLALKKEEADLLSSYQDYTSIEKGGKSSKEEKENAKAARGTAAARKAQREAETELQKALKDELQLIDKVRSQYKKLTDAGVNSREAIVMVTNQFKNSIAQINKVLGKNGIPLFDIKTFAGTDNPYRLLQMLEKQLKSAKGAKNVKPSEIKDLELKISELHVDVKTYDTKKIAEGLNSSLAKIKDEYELAVELDANPELGNIFADAFGIDTSTLPKSIADMIERVQDEVNRAIRNAESLSPRYLLDEFDILSGDLKAWAKKAGIEINSELYKEMESAQKTAREAFKKNVIDTEKILDDYVNKYGDYADKIAEIEAERLTKMKQLNDRYALGSMSPLQYSQAARAIEQSAFKERDKVAWDEFKDSEYYVAMFEKLEYVSTSTLKSIRDRLTEVKNSWKDLSPEQLKWVTQQYEKLDAELLKRKPFANLTANVRNYIEALKSGKEAETRFATAQDFYDKAKATESVWKQLLEYKKRNEDLSSLSDDDVAMIARQAGAQKELVEIILQGVIARGLSKEAIEEETLAIAEQVRKAKAALDAASENKASYDYAKKIFKEQGEAITKAVGDNLISLGELRDFIRDDLGLEVSEELDGITNGLVEAGQGVNKIVSDLSSGNFVGALVGVGKTLYGVYDSIANIWGAGSARNMKIDKKIKDSELSVKRLENAYINLEYAINKAYGAAAVGAKKAAISNKQLQLVELQRQLALEKSRKKKDRDEDKILELEGQIRSLRNEIKSSEDDIVNDLMGISSVGDAAEQLVSSMIDAFKNGEDYMKVYEESFEDMIDNMIVKAIAGELIGDKIQRIFDDIKQSKILEAKNARPEYEDLTYESAIERAQFILSGLEAQGITEGWLYNYWVERLKQWQREYGKLLSLTPQDISDIGTEVAAWKDDIKGEFLAMMDAFGITYGQSAENQLSNLQQGLQSMSESTAESLEAYMNGVSQQVYYHSSLLEQIRDAVVGFDMDVQLGVFSQMLLQLQNNYIVMQSMQSMMENWTIPSGNGIRVELLS